MAGASLPHRLQLMHSLFTYQEPETLSLKRWLEFFMEGTVAVIFHCKKFIVSIN